MSMLKQIDPNVNSEKPPQLELFDVGRLVGFIRNHRVKDSVYPSGLLLDNALYLLESEWYDWFMNNANAYWNNVEFMVNTCIVEEYRTEVLNALKP